MPNSETTFIEEAGVYVCNNCGANASSPEKIKHHDNCKIGESKRWKELYDEAAYLEAEKTEETWWEEHYNTILIKGGKK